MRRTILLALAVAVVPTFVRAAGSVMCNDGVIVAAGRRACAGHRGGVGTESSWAQTPHPQSPIAGVDPPKDAVYCKDGTAWWKPEREACQGHGDQAGAAEPPAPWVPPPNLTQLPPLETMPPLPGTTHAVATRGKRSARASSGSDAAASRPGSGSARRGAPAASSDHSEE
jgi:hypothetical protein